MKKTSIRDLLAYVPVIAVFILLAIPTDSVQAQSDKLWKDSLVNISSPAEPDLQFLLDSLGYAIDVEQDELGLDVFCVADGPHVATLILELARSARFARSGFYIAGDTAARTQLFKGSDRPGDSVSFTFEGEEVGFYIQPRIPSFGRDIWFTESRFNVDGQDHALVFATGIPGEFLIAFEDVAGTGDGDFQDLLVRVRFETVPPELRLPSNFSRTICPDETICFDVSAAARACSSASVTLDLLAGAGEFSSRTFPDSGTASHCFVPDTSGVYRLIFRATAQGLVTVDTVNVDVTVRQAPVCVVPSDTLIEQCQPEEIRLALSSGCDIVIGPGEIIIDEWVYTPVGEEDVSVTIRCEDQCGVYCEETFAVSIRLTVENAARIELNPAGDLNPVAGDTIVFSATSFDCTGANLGPVAVTLSFDPAGDQLGDLSGDTLFVTSAGVGRVVASVDGVSDTSGTISVLPGPPVSVDLQIYPTQLVERPLIVAAQVILVDAFGNPTDNVDLTTTPLELHVDQGGLSPATINGPVGADGTIDLIDVGVIYKGPSTTASVTAAVGGTASAPVSVAFNAYQITGLLDGNNDPFTVLFSEDTTDIRIAYENGGDLTGIPNSPVSVTLLARMQRAVSSYDPSPAAVRDTIDFQLRPVSNDPPFDTVLVELVSRFDIQGQEYLLVDTVRRGVTVRSSAPSATWTVVPGSFEPDSAFTEHPLPIHFELNTPGTDSLIDSVAIQISLVENQDPQNSQVVLQDTLYDVVRQDGQALFDFTRWRPGRLRQGAPSGWYSPVITLVGYDGGQMFVLADQFPDSVEVFQRPVLRALDGSLRPMTVAPGMENSFSFDVAVETEVPLTQSREISFQFRSSDGNFLVIAPGLDLAPIEGNDTITVTSSGLALPSSLVGDSVRIVAGIWLATPILDAGTVSAGMSPGWIKVVDAATVKLVSVDAVAPNRPFVNTSQGFTVRARVANISGLEATDVAIGIASDGSSQFSSQSIVADVPAGDTVEVAFDITAASTPTAVETFVVRIDTGDYVAASPDDNSVGVTIQTPARLELEARTFAVTDGGVIAGQPFGLSVQLRNAGEASVSSGRFALQTPGQLFGSEELVSGNISAGEVLSFDFTAPSIDTSGTFTFMLTEFPLDLNTGEQAPATDTNFSFDVDVTMLAGGLVVEPTIITTDLVSRNSDEDLFRLSLSNTSNLTDISLDRIVLDFTDRLGGMVDLDDLLDAGETVFRENDATISVAAISAARLQFEFSDFVLQPTETRQLIFEISIGNTSESDFTVSLDRDNLLALFTSDQGTGQRVPIISSITDQLLVSETYTIRGGTLEESFVIETNPFNPVEQPAVFAYSLARESGVQFEVFTVTGERVYSLNRPAGSSGTQAGRNIIEWDGLNDEGRQVLNGVYIVCLRAVALGEEGANEKAAVVK